MPRTRSLRFNAYVGPAAISSSMRSRQPGRIGDINSARSAIRQVVKRYERLVEHIEEVTPDVLFSALEPTFEKSQRYCPKDTGRLAESGYLVITETRGVPTVEMGYGRGNEPPYAAVVHENMEWRHKSPTRAKWLQAALGEDEQLIQQRIADGMREIFR